jgi:hypothetical protein
MPNFKYEIGQQLYPAGCSAEYKKANPFTVVKREMRKEDYESCGEIWTSLRPVYSSGSDEHYRLWLDERSLTTTLSAQP